MQSVLPLPPARDPGTASGPQRRGLVVGHGAPHRAPRPAQDHDAQDHASRSSTIREWEILRESKLLATLARPVPPAPEALPDPQGSAKPAEASAGLCTRLAELAYRHPHRIAFIDPLAKPDWTGRAAITWTYAAATEIVARLANGLRGWRLPPGSRIGLCLEGGAESLIAYLAVEAAGHVPCLLPIAWDEARLLAAVQSAGLSAVLTQTRFGASLPAERLCRVALGYFGLRYVAAFGPAVPDGVISLDGMVLDERGGPFAAQTGDGVVSFAAGDPARPMHRPAASLLAAIAHCRARTRVAPGERVLTLLPGGDLRSLVTGLGTALFAGGSLEILPVFEAAAFAQALARPLPTHLVLPAGLEANLARIALPGTLRSVALAHRAPLAFGPALLRPVAERTIVDLVDLDATAILAGAREADDVARTLADPSSAALPPIRMAMRIEPDGRLAIRGEACQAHPLRRGIQAETTADGWTLSRFRTEIRDGLATALTVA
jgi:non-ribosomal peptide synthetase component F